VVKPTGFLEYPREEPPNRPVEDRVRDFLEVEEMLPPSRLQIQAARCMDCGIPFCHSYGCPVKNRIPDWNDLIYRKQWRKALDLLHATCNLPEVTGRVCPAPCETACTLSINQEPVTIRHIELQIVERGWTEGWIVPEPAPRKTGRKVAVVGSGPAGLSAAQQLARAGHNVVVFEKADRAGGLLRYGIPDFKMEKWVIDRRLEQMRAEGVVFETGVNAGVDLSVTYMRRTFDAILVASGATVPRDLPATGRPLSGIHFAMEFLARQNRRNAGETIPADQEIDAAGKHVVVIGGGDTGSDCVGTSRRQGAASITQVELLPEPPKTRAPFNPWPTWPVVMRSSSSHEEGCTRLWSVATKEFVGENGVIRKLRCANLEWSEPDASGRRGFREIPGSEFELPAALVLLAMGFVHVEHGPLVHELGLALDSRGNILADADSMASTPGVFAAGDSTLGASLVVRAIDAGRKAAEGINRYLKQAG
jgi:NAD(P)H-dependent glutamate synthase small subunit